MPIHKIVYTNLASPLGEMIAGTTDKGLSFLEWHDRGGVPRILKRVEKRYRLPLEGGKHQFLDRLKQELESYFSGTLRQFSLPLDIKGTAFERATWDLLLKIPFGAKRTYGDLATKLNRPGASRAVGRANGANYLSIIVPCHRVVAAGDRLCGYGGGVRRKEWLLNHEARAVGAILV
jgi:O-6-methylguanine DNA methyltransferase